MPFGLATYTEYLLFCFVYFICFGRELLGLGYIRPRLKLC